MTCPHTSLHGVELEHRSNFVERGKIGPDAWECDGCLTLQVEDTVGLLDAKGRDIRRINADLLAALLVTRELFQNMTDLHIGSSYWRLVNKAITQATLGDPS